MCVVGRGGRARLRCLLVVGCSCVSGVFVCPSLVRCLGLGLRVLREISSDFVRGFFRCGVITTCNTLLLVSRCGGTTTNMFCKLVFARGATTTSNTLLLVGRCGVTITKNC